MALVSDIEIRLRADIARLQQDMNAARRTVDRGMDAITTAANAAKRALGGLAAGFGLAEIGRQVLGAQREFDKLNSSLITATGSTQNAASAFKALQAFAAATPYSVAEATEAFIKLRNLGLTPSERALGSYGNTAAAMGKGLNQMIEAVADAATGEFERLKEFGIKAKQNGDQVSLTFQGVTKTIGNNAKDIEAYLMRLGEVEFAGAMERRANTLDGAISALGDTWQSVMRAISTNGIGDGAMSGVLGLTAALGDLSRMLEAVGAVTAEEGKKAQESSIIHQSLTGVFRGLLVIGINVKNVIGGLADGIVALATAAGQVASRDFAGAKKTMEAASAAGQKRAENWKAEIQATVDVHQAVKLVQRETLAGFAVVQTAEEKRAAAAAAIVDIQNKVNGVNKDAAGELAKLKTALDTGAISQAEYNRLAGRINKDTVLASTAYKDQVKALDMSSDAIQRRAAAQAFDNKQAAEQLAFLNRTGQLNDADYIEKRGAAEVKALQDAKAATEAQIAVESKRIDNAQKLAALRGEVAKANQEIAAREVQTQNELFELDQRQFREAAEAKAAREEAAQDDTRSLREQVQAQKDATAEIGLTEQQVLDLTVARMRDQAAALDRRAEIEINEEVAAQLREQAALTRQLADGKKYAEQARQTKQFWGDVEKTAHDTFVSIADGGKDAFTRLKDSAKNIFFEWLYQMTLKKWIVNIGTSTEGGGGLASLFGDGGSSGWMSAGASLFKGFTKNFSSGLGGVFTQLGEKFGISTYSAANARAAASASQSSVGGGAGSMGGGIAAAVVAGMMANNKFFDQGWRLAGQANDIIKSQLGSMLKGNGLAPITAIMTASMSSFEKLLGKIGVNNKFASMLSGSAVFARAFGHKAPEITAQGLQGTLSASGFDGKAFANILQKGGWFRSDKRSVKTSALDAGQESALDTTMQAMAESARGFADVLGVSTNAINGYSKQIKLELTSDEAKNQELITRVFGEIGDDLARAVLPSIDRFRADGETAAVTLQRVAADFQAVTAILDMMGTDSQTAFRAVGAASIDARERLLALAGGVDALAAQTTFFNQNFLTQAEQIAPVQKQVTAQLKALGYGSVTTVEQFKAAVQGLVKSGALATESGAKTYAGLLALAPAFKAVTDAAAQARAALIEGLQADAGKLADVVDAQKDRVAAAYAEVMDQLDIQLGTVNDTIERTRALAEALRGAMRGVETPQQAAGSRMAAQAQVMTALAIAKASGVLPTADDLRDALGTLAQGSADQFGTLADYQRDVARTNAMLDQFGGLADVQVSAAERQVQLLEAQQAAAQAGLDAELARLDRLVAAAQAQIDKANGTTLDQIAAYARSVQQAIVGVGKEVAAPTVPVQAAVPRVVGVSSGPSAATMAAAAVVSLDEATNKRLANLESAMNRTAASVDKLATQFDQVSAGGNALATEAVR